MNEAALGSICSARRLVLPDPQGGDVEFDPL